MKQVIFAILVGVSANALALSVKPEYIKSMTRSQCLADPTVRFVANQYRQQYPNLSMDQVMRVMCKEAK
jgi:hypothetical protein